MISPNWKDGQLNIPAVTGLSRPADFGVFAMDLDGPEGLAWAKSINLPESLVVATGGEDAYHAYFRQPADVRIKNSAKKIAPGVDVRGDGGYTVLPPSIHPDTGKQYQFLKSVHPAFAPEWLVALLTEDSEPSAPPFPWSADSLPQITNAPMLQRLSEKRVLPSQPSCQGKVTGTMRPTSWRSLSPDW